MARLPDKEKAKVIDWIQTKYRQSKKGEHVPLSEVAKYLSEIGFKRSTQTVYRWIQEAKYAVDNQVVQTGFDLDAPLDFSDTETINDYRLNLDHIPLLRRAVGFYDYSNAEWAINQMPTFRWAKFASYFLDAVVPTTRHDKVDPMDTWTIGQYLSARDKDRERVHSELRAETATFDDVESWLNYQPFEKNQGAKYQRSISNGSVTPLERLHDDTRYGGDVQPTADLISDVFIHLCQLTGIYGAGQLPSWQYEQVKKHTKEDRPENKYFKINLITTAGMSGHSSTVFNPSYEK